MKILYKLLIMLGIVSVLPLLLLGLVTNQDMNNVIDNVQTDLGDMKETVVSSSNNAVENLVSDSFIREGNLIVENIELFLDERVQDTLALAELIEGADDAAQAQALIEDFYNSKSREYWYNSNTDINPVERRITIPLYSQISYVGSDGQEIVKIVDGSFSSDLKDVSDPSNTEFMTEDYFSKGMATDEVYVSRLNTWYTTAEESREGAPEGTTTYDVVPGRDAMKDGNIRFTKKLDDGLVVLSLDYRHLQSLVKHIDPEISERVVSTSYEGNYILFFDDQGYTLVHPKPNNIRGYLSDGTLEHTNTVETPGGIFNLRDYNKNNNYRSMYDRTIGENDVYVSSSTDVSGRTKMVVVLPVEFAFGEYKDSGLFGGIMMSVNTDNFYSSVHAIEDSITKDVDMTKASILDSLQSLNKKIIGLSLLVILIAVTFGIVFAKNLTKPIRELTKTADKLNQGDIDVTVNVVSKDEIGSLAASMEGLIMGVKALKQQVAEKAKPAAKKKKK